MVHSVLNYARAYELKYKVGFLQALARDFIPDMAVSHFIQIAPSLLSSEPICTAKLLLWNAREGSFVKQWSMPETRKYDFMSPF